MIAVYDCYTGGDMMERTLQQWRTLGAVLFAAVLIGGAVVVRGDYHAQGARASTESELLKAIATQDTDGDGLPDWEEALYGADPNKVDTFGLGMSDKEAASRGLVIPKAIANIDADPASTGSASSGLTATFTEQLYARYRILYDEKGGALTSADLLAVTQDAFTAFSQSTKPADDLVRREDLSISGSGRDVLRGYAVAVESVLQANTHTAAESELVYLEQAVKNGDDGALIEISGIAKSYRNSAVGISKLPVPRELAGEALRLVNAFARLSGILEDFTRVRTDPLATMLALSQYPHVALALANALVDTSALYEAADVTFAPHDPGATLVHMISRVVEGQKAENSGL
jgi:hypothetical protein